LGEDKDLEQMRETLAATIARNRDLLSAKIARADGGVLAELGDAQAAAGFDPDLIQRGRVRVPLVVRGERWGTVELQFRPAAVAGPPFWRRPIVQLVLFTTLLSCGIFFLYLRGMLEHFDPARVVPNRVRSALDTLAEGLVVLDNHERIVLANEAFARTLRRTPEELSGRRASNLPWVLNEVEDGPAVLPWLRALQDGRPRTGTVLGLETADGERKLFRVNSSPIFSDDGRQRGALVSFDDVTLIERNRAELREMLQVLEDSRDEISRQNEELQVLATQDPLTLCLNRRSFFATFELHWNFSRQHGDALSCVMVDVDNFKAINDEHGHAVGDQVLKRIAELLRSGRRDTDLVCRLGGEEFCVLLPSADADYARHVAETIRQAIAATPLAGLSVTASFGVASNAGGARDPHELLNQADKALYAAKHNGRNLVVRWEDVPEDWDVEDDQLSRLRSIPTSDPETAIPFHAVTALVSALAYRDAATAEHSRRVADLCVSAASGLMSVGDAYILEIAALLHDIGKIGVPDAVLLKPGPLTDEEWKMMGAQERVGVEIIRTTFASNQLARIVQTHQAWYNGGKPGIDLKGDEIPLAARLLAVADAYDAMVTDRVYRKGREQEEAFAELRRCAGKQFDPELVERLIETVQARDENRAPPLDAVSKQTALRIGVEIERLAAALDEQDLFGLTVLAGRLKATAAKEGIAPIAEAAAQLEQVAADDPNLMEVVQLTTDLLRLCRSTQRAYLRDALRLGSSAGETPAAPVAAE
jgi:diguanylate cyclase (GGDEF)-like protein/PAS domain S-box-containing protein